VKGDKIIVDADILSMFAKVDAIDVLQEFLGRERVVMTPAIRDEVSAPLLATNDYAARKLAKSRGVRTVSLQAILRGLWLSGMRGKAEVRELLDRIKEVDNLEVSLEVEREIFGEDV
jgi:hypothetical protein